jgi:hypothetical protein
MYACRLCGLTVEEIPVDAVLIGKLYKFSDGSFHFLRKKRVPGVPMRKHRKNPDREAPEVAQEKS